MTQVLTGYGCFGEYTPSPELGVDLSPLAVLRVMLASERGRRAVASGNAPEGGRRASTERGFHPEWMRGCQLHGWGTRAAHHAIAHEMKTEGGTHLPLPTDGISPRGLKMYVFPVPGYPPYVLEMAIVEVLAGGHPR
jgi:hypothetical protein